MSIQTILLTGISLLILSVIFCKRFRFYLASYFFSNLYFNQKIAKFIGIEFDHVFEYAGNRKKSRIYSDGVFVKILKMITGMDLRVSDSVRAEMIKLQRDHSKQIDMKPYFNEIADKEITLLEFEYFLSKILLIETNKLYDVFTKEQLNDLVKYSVVVFEVLNGLSGGMMEGFKLLFLNIKSLYIISKILRTAPEAKRLMVFGPQLSLITNLSKMIMRFKAANEEIKETKKSENSAHAISSIIKQPSSIGSLLNIDTLEPYNFLDLQTKFFVFEENHDNRNHKLVFLHRDTDKSNGVDNKAFGPKYVACPGNRITIDYINSILDFLRSVELRVQGTAMFEGVRFKNISNKKNITVLFTLKKISNQNKD